MPKQTLVEARDIDPSSTIRLNGADFYVCCVHVNATNVLLCGSFDVRTYPDMVAVTLPNPDALIEVVRG